MTNKITIIGGTYFEDCSYPRKRLHRGSGGRAACLLSNWNLDVELHTANGPELASSFDDLALHFRFKLCAVRKTSDISFRYRHPLSSPQIYGDLSNKVKYPSAITTNKALIFGMLEERPLVNAQKAVYDPQDGCNAERFSSNGSRADELAIVVSHSEGKKLTGHDTPEVIAEYLLKEDNAKVAIIKCGPIGALVATSEKKEWVRAFPTDSVFKIGSGDVFSSAFSFEWLINDRDPFTAAWFASRVTAEYVDNASDRIDISTIDKLREEAASAHKQHSDSPKRAIPESQIYLAGPFFNTAEQWRIDEAREALLDMGFNVFSPIHDVGEGDINYVATSDLVALDNSDIVLAMLDGLDCGTIFEVGYARAQQKPVIVVAESIDNKDLTMIIGSGCILTRDFSAGIYKTCWMLMGDISE
ncbi:PfkB family carbohydrate kinase [Photobacterium ganghwense]|uniref:PfkB family carbohydrate kinase n=1 Tax=Photobacterium ganghwense TaxID=320778 RepID=UPI001A8FDC78|nr:PfkB family carbohydrate kinase [Photobacterium ganghwense]QSV13779.1 nucleoside 2-deoxyribosyltransferase [Photobacterium ganghwense]